MLPCPNCGNRSVYEFDFGGEHHSRPSINADPSEWPRYLYLRRNLDGPQIEWWYHRQGCKLWFLAERDTRTNVVERAFWPGENPSLGDSSAAAPSASHTKD